MDILVTVGMFAVVLKGIVDALRRQFPKLDGIYVQLISVVIGALAAWGFDLKATAALLDQSGAHVGRMPVPAVDYLITGVAIAFTAGIFAEAVGLSGGTRTITYAQPDD